MCLEKNVKIIGGPRDNTPQYLNSPGRAKLKRWILAPYLKIFLFRLNCPLKALSPYLAYGKLTTLALT